MISLVNVDEEYGEVFQKEVEIMAAEILWGKPYSCPVLKLGKNKEFAGDVKLKYDFDISKPDKIFDHVIKD